MIVIASLMRNYAEWISRQLRKKRLVFFQLMEMMILISMLSGLLVPVGVAAQGDPVQEIFKSMTPEEKVGQLFLVSFNGTDVSAQSQIYDLISNRHVGGVVLSAGNDNFSAENTAFEAYHLTNALQAAEYDNTQNPATPTAPHQTIPLFIGISQEGGGAPNDQILNGLTNLPSQLSIGATWDRNLSEQVGAIMGKELSALGFNLYLGLSLDVLSLPDPAVSADMTNQIFGGDPYWVGEMASAYITGLHTGSDGKMMVIAKHFPGEGGSDRVATQEIPTIRRSLEELKSIELAPFFAVTGDATDPKMTVDGILVSHIRYQGFQGNIRATTRPISFDQQALSQIMALPELSSWKKNGGLVISEDLSTPAVRRFYDPDYHSFIARLIARDAFLAGNDVLYMGNILSTDSQDNYSSVTKTLDFFAQRYREDTAFASRVDDSVQRILRAKFRTYGTFDQESVVSKATEPNLPLQATDQVFKIARQSATLVSPSPADLANVLPEPPNLTDYIVFLTDARMTRQCSTCPDKPILAGNAFHSAVQRLYGPSANGLVTPSHLSSFTFDDINAFLNGKLATDDLPNALGRATWIVLSTQALPKGSDQLNTLRRFLTEKQSILSSKKVILFSFNAPYYLDTTDISKLTAYYCLYSATDQYVDVAARLLFQEISPAGFLPVSVPAIGYDMISVTTPDPTQIISLNLDFSKNATPTPAKTSTPSSGKATVTPRVTLKPEPTQAPIFRVGDTISLATGIIYDHNHHQVPDGTPVRFSMSRSDNSLLQQVDAVTSRGLAKAAFRLDSDGLLEFKVTSEPAKSSDTIQLDVSREGATIIIITPTAEMNVPVPTLVVPSPTPTSTPSPLVNKHGYPTFWGWLMALLVMMTGVGLTYWLASEMVDARWRLRWSLLVLLGGLLAYNYLVLGLPWGELWLDGRGLGAFLQAELIGQGIGFGIGWFWRLAAESGNQAEQ